MVLNLANVNILHNVNAIHDIEITISLPNQKCAFVFGHFQNVFVNIITTDQSQKRDEDIIQLSYQDKI